MVVVLAVVLAGCDCAEFRPELPIEVVVPVACWSELAPGSEEEEEDDDEDEDEEATLEMTVLNGTLGTTLPPVCVVLWLWPFAPVLAVVVVEVVVSGVVEATALAVGGIPVAWAIMRPRGAPRMLVKVEEVAADDEIGL